MIDKESQRIIDSVKKNFSKALSHVGVFTVVTAWVIVTEFIQWVNNQDARELGRKITDKMTKGAEEHGPVTKEQCQKELEQEYLDLFGWTFRRRG